VHLGVIEGVGMPNGNGGAMPGKFEVKVAKDGEVYFHLKATNGQIVLSSEM
jgi:hypothetical protein